MRFLFLIIVFSCFSLIANKDDSKTVNKGGSKSRSWSEVYQRAVGGAGSVLQGAADGVRDYAGRAYATCPRYSQLSKVLSDNAHCQNNPYYIVKLIGIIEGCGYYRAEKRPAFSCLRAYRDSKYKPAFLERATNNQAERFMQATLRWLLDAKEAQNKLSENEAFIEVPLSKKYLIDVLDGVYFKMTFDDDLSEIMQEEIDEGASQGLSLENSVNKALESKRLKGLSKKMKALLEKMKGFIRKVYLHKKSSGPIFVKVPIQSTSSLFVDLYRAFESTGKPIQDNNLAERVYENWWVHFFMDEFKDKEQFSNL